MPRCMSDTSKLLSLFLPGVESVALRQSKTETQYDAVIVGSGAGGGMAAYQLAVQGMKVLVLEAGRDYDPITETPMFQTPRDAPLRGAGNADTITGDAIRADQCGGEPCLRAGFIIIDGDVDALGEREARVVPSQLHDRAAYLTNLVEEVLVAR